MIGYGKIEFHIPNSNGCIYTFLIIAQHSKSTHNFHGVVGLVVINICVTGTKFPTTKYHCEFVTHFCMSTLTLLTLPTLFTLLTQTLILTPYAKHRGPYTTLFLKNLTPKTGFLTSSK